MNIHQANEQIARFFGGQELTFCIERVGENFEEWIARCNEIPAISTSGFGFDERAIRDQVRDAVITSAGIDGEFADSVLREFTIKNELAVSI